MTGTLALSDVVVAEAAFISGPISSSSAMPCSTSSRCQKAAALSPASSAGCRWVAGPMEVSRTPRTAAAATARSPSMPRRMADSLTASSTCARKKNTDRDNN
eukprot:scaffold664980_cov34-Prasinocladus_malaysianus.AAC.1